MGDHDSNAKGKGYRGIGDFNDLAQRRGQGADRGQAPAGLNDVCVFYDTPVVPPGLKLLRKLGVTSLV